MEKQSEGILGTPLRWGRTTALLDATWRLRGNLLDALTELRVSQQDRAFMATGHGLDAAPVEDRITAHAICQAQPDRRRRTPPPFPSL